MAFRSKHPIRTKIVINNITIEQVSNFQYLGCNVRYLNDIDVQQKVSKFQAICGTIKGTLGKKARKLLQHPRETLTITQLFLTLHSTLTILPTKWRRRTLSIYSGNTSAHEHSSSSY